ncbi:MAG: hypothetical protein H5U08_00745 [Thermogutta sp.]|uniref:hypothetical protein n=1 Tax=Thermogutta sp. TaxID=1962930 RepID=UPI0019AB641E|nr:hypothetical protein [Thermogutta sp.]MBC7350863.1 hypothetical protein [Thermogutta sp.]
MGRTHFFALAELSNSGSNTGVPFRPPQLMVPIRPNGPSETAYRQPPLRSSRLNVVFSQWLL